MPTDHKPICTWCHQKAPDYNSILIPGETENFRICLHCYNQEISRAVGIEYDQIQLHPIILKDRNEKDHTFHFSLRLMGETQVLKAFEILDDRSGGYEFTMTGETRDGIFPLFSTLYTNMLTALGRKHIFKDPETGQWQITRKNRVRGQILSSGKSDHPQGSPAVRVDGNTLSWEELGRMLMTYEGFNFKLEIIDDEEEDS